MKKLIILLSAVLLVFGTTGIAGATFYEAYTAVNQPWQYVGEGDSFNFGFDMWYDNDDYGVGTDSNLTLTTDAEGAQGVDWYSATVFVDLYSFDDDWEMANISIFAWDGHGFQNSIPLNMDEFNFNQNDTNNAYYYYSYTFDANELASFEKWGWGNLNIGATSISDGNYNDFGIKRVAMEVSAAPVPEPATMLLLGSGLIGISFVGRKKFFKK